MDYIHFNPVKHGLVKEARAWEYSSFAWRRVYIRRNGVARRVIRFMAGNGSDLIGVTAHSSGSLWLACVGVLEHALRLLTPHQTREAQKRPAEGETQRSIACSYNVSQATISRLTTHIAS
jgi:hypothetical protein